MPIAYSLGEEFLYMFYSQIEMSTLKLIKLGWTKGGDLDLQGETRIKTKINVNRVSTYESTKQN